MSESHINNVSRVQYFHHTVINRIMDFVGGTLICSGWYISPFPELARHWGRRAEIKQVFPPTYYGDFMRFAHLFGKMSEICLLDIIHPGIQKQIVYTFSKIQMFYRPINSRLGKLMFAPPRNAGACVTWRLSSMSKKFRPSKYYRKCKLGREIQAYSDRKMIFGLKSLIQ